MTFIITLVSILQSFAISLGVGSSTLAIVNFFAAIADGTIEPTERRMMGIVYVVLRIAMVGILLTTLFLLFVKFLYGGAEVLTAYDYAQLSILLVLFVNAALMTAHIMPSTFGPALQAGSWYALGGLAALVPLSLTGFTYATFVLGYVTWLILAIAIVNSAMAIQKARHNRKRSQNPA